MSKFAKAVEHVDLYWLIVNTIPSPKGDSQPDLDLIESMLQENLKQAIRNWLKKYYLNFSISQIVGHIIILSFDSSKFQRSRVGSWRV